MSAKDAGARLPRGIARFRGRYRVRMDYQGTTQSLGVASPQGATTSSGAHRVRGGSTASRTHST